MATPYTYVCTLPYSTGTVPEVDELEVEVSFSVAWGSAGTGRPYYGPPENYDEGSPDEVEDLTLKTIDGASGPFDQEVEALILQEIAQNHTEDMLTEAREIEAAWADDSGQYRREENW